MYLYTNTNTEMFNVVTRWIWNRKDGPNNKCAEGPPGTVVPCNDYDTHVCRKWKAEGDCDSDATEPSTMHALCPRSCGACPS